MLALRKARPLKNHSSSMGSIRITYFKKVWSYNETRNSVIGAKIKNITNSKDIGRLSPIYSSNSFLNVSRGIVDAKRAIMNTCMVADSILT